MPLLRPPPTPALTLLWGTLKAAASIKPEYRAWQPPSAPGDEGILLFGPPQGLKVTAASQVPQIAARLKGITGVSMERHEWSNRPRWFVAVRVGDSLRKMLAEEFLSGQENPLSEESRTTCLEILHAHVLPAQSLALALDTYTALTGATQKKLEQPPLSSEIRDWIKWHLLHKNQTFRLGMTHHLSSATHLRKALLSIPESVAVSHPLPRHPTTM